MRIKNRGKGWADRVDPAVEKQVCRLCGQEKLLLEYYRRSEGRRAYVKNCKACVNGLNRRSTREQRNERKQRYRAKYPEKLKAQYRLRYAVKMGRVQKPSACSDCGRTGVVICGHHRDYGKPLEVEWYCYRCHRRLHVEAAR